MAIVTRRKKRRRSPPKPQEERKHPPQWQGDLNPRRAQSHNIGRSSLDEDPHARTAAEIKSLNLKLSDFSPQELRAISILPAGNALKEGAVYLDLKNPTLGPFVATGGMVAKKNNCYAPKAEIPYEYWNRLLNVLGPDRGKAEENFGGEAARKPEEESKPSEMPDSMIDETIAESFPASDPPSWTTGREKR